MDSQPKNIENALREKFESYAAAPPEHIWEGVAAGIGATSTPLISANVWRGIGIAAIVLLLLSLGSWWFWPKDGDGPVQENTEEIIAMDNEADADETATIQADDPATVQNPDPAVSPHTNPTVHDSESTVIDTETGDTGLSTDQESIVMTTPVVTEVEEISEEPSSSAFRTDEDGDETTTIEGDTRPTFYAIAALDSEIDNELNEPSPKQVSLPPSLITGPSQNTQSKGWSHGFYFTPEVMLTEFESITILPSYSFNYEPTYHFNNHFFMRFGLGLQYSRDRGVATIDYLQNEVVGSYEDVYEITFDSVGGNLVPTYHTKTREIWDTVSRVQISDVTNKYMYLQVPLLFGYHKKAPRINWFFYGGPAVNMMVSKWIENPNDGLNDVTIIDLQNNLPERSPYFFQLWIGAGIEYKFNKKLALALEPNYRYYFDQVYEDDAFKRGLSSFGLRVGLVYMVK